MAERVIQQIALDLIDEAPQVREHFDPEKLMGLAGTIRVHGIHQPIVVRPVGSRYQTMTGARRCRAAKMAGLSEVPATVIDRDLTEAEILELQLLENCAREDLNPVEKARAFTKWMSLTGRTATELARIAGMSTPVLSKLSALLVLVPDVLSLVESGKLPYSAACEIAKFSDPAEQRRLADLVVNKGVSRDRLVAQTKAVRAARGKTLSRKPRQARRERVVIPCGQGRSVAVSAPALTVEGVIAWLTDLVERLRHAGANGRALGDVVKELSACNK